MPESISNRCPACGTSSLIVGNGGLLVCGYLECKDPTMVDRALETLDELRQDRDRSRRRAARIDEILRPFERPEIPTMPEPVALGQEEGNA